MVAKSGCGCGRANSNGEEKYDEFRLVILADLEMVGFQSICHFLGFFSG